VSRNLGVYRLIDFEIELLPQEMGVKRANLVMQCAMSWNLPIN
jgi:hypothetical protein